MVCTYYYIVFTSSPIPTLDDRQEAANSVDFFQELSIHVIHKKGERKEEGKRERNELG